MERRGSWPVAANAAGVSAVIRTPVRSAAARRLLTEFAALVESQLHMLDVRAREGLCAAAA